MPPTPIHNSEAAAKAAAEADAGVAALSLQDQPPSTPLSASTSSANYVMREKEYRRLYVGRMRGCTVCTGRASVCLFCSCGEVVPVIKNNDTYINTAVIL